MPSFAASLETAGSKKTVFKVNTGKLPFSVNTSEWCVYCGAGRALGAPPLPLCAGCASTAKQHQIVHWPEHKAFCKAQRSCCERVQDDSTTGISRVQKLRYLIEDWTSLHKKSIEQALAWELHTFSPPYDFHDKYAHFWLKYRPESEDNPSLAFEVVSVEWRDPPVAVDSVSALLGQLDQTHEGDKRTFRGYMSAVPCLYHIVDGLSWWSAEYIFANTIPTHWPKDMPFYYTLRCCADKGLIYRQVGDNMINSGWVLGLMTKHASGTKWVWKEHTLAELEAKGVGGLFYLAYPVPWPSE